MNRFQSWYRSQPRALRALLTINAIIYVAWILVLSHISATASIFYEYLALNPALPDILFRPWQLVTYNFLHLSPGFWGFIHILFNMLWLYWIGREHEDLHGPHSLVALYLLTGIGGGLLSVLLHGFFPGVGAFGGIIYGASASVLGVMTAVAVMYPFKKIALLLIGSVRLIYVVIAFLVLDLLFLSSGGTAVAAHLGGVAFGFLFVKIEQKGVDLSSWARFFFRDRRRRQKVSVPEDAGWLDRMEAWLAARSKGGKPKKKKSRPVTEKIRSVATPEPERSSLESEVDRILDKISEMGYDSLTEEEKRILHEFSRR